MKTTKGRETSTIMQSPLVWDTTPNYIILLSCRGFLLFLVFSLPFLSFFFIHESTAFSAPNLSFTLSPFLHLLHKAPFFATVSPSPFPPHSPLSLSLSLKFSGSLKIKENALISTCKTLQFLFVFSVCFIKSYLMRFY